MEKEKKYLVVRQREGDNDKRGELVIVARDFKKFAETLEEALIINEEELNSVIERIWRFESHFASKFQILEIIPREIKVNISLE